MEFPIQRLVRRLGITLKSRNKRPAIQTSRRFLLRQLGNCRQEIPERDDRIARGLCWNNAGPSHEKGDADAAFIQIPFDAVEGAIAIEEVRIVAAFLMGPVIAGKTPYRLLFQGEFAERVISRPMSLSMRVTIAAK